MTTDIPPTTLSVASLVKPDGELEVSLVARPMPEPAAHEVLVKVLATPINPSDIFLLFPSIDPTAMRPTTRDGRPALSATLPPAALRALDGRVGDEVAIGSEGSGIVVKAGSSPEAQALLGKTVAMYGGGMYAEYRCLDAALCLVLPDGIDARTGASWFVNPLTALGFVETVRQDGHRAIIQTAAGSSLGQMLNRICINDGIPLINIVRNPAQVALLRDQGARHVLNSGDADFRKDLEAAIAETRATVAFDAIGGGKLGGQLLSAMEAVYGREMGAYSRYGSNIAKQLYIYGSLDLSPTILSRTYGFRWSVSGWLLTNFLSAAGKEVEARLHARVMSELETTFATSYSHEISLTDTLDPAIVAGYSARKTGEKYLIRP